MPRRSSSRSIAVLSPEKEKSREPSPAPPDREAETVAVAPRGDAVDDRAARVAEARPPRDLVEGLARARRRGCARAGRSRPSSTRTSSAWPPETTRPWKGYSTGRAGLAVRRRCAEKRCPSRWLTARAAPRARRRAPWRPRARPGGRRSGPVRRSRRPGRRPAESALAPPRARARRRPAGSPGARAPRARARRRRRARAPRAARRRRSRAPGPRRRARRRRSRRRRSRCRGRSWSGRRASARDAAISSGEPCLEPRARDSPYGGRQIPCSVTIAVM